MSIPLEIEVAKLLQQHALPVYKQAVAENWGMDKLIDNQMALGLCYFFQNNHTKFKNIICYFFETYYPFQYVVNTPCFLHHQDKNCMTGITSRIAWMENFIAQHLPNNKTT